MHDINEGKDFRKDSQESGELKHSQLGISAGTRGSWPVHLQIACTLYMESATHYPQHQGGRG